MRCGGRDRWCADEPGDLEQRGGRLGVVHPECGLAGESSRVPGQSGLLERRRGLLHLGHIWLSLQHPQPRPARVGKGRTERFACRGLTELARIGDQGRGVVREDGGLHAVPTPRHRPRRRRTQSREQTVGGRHQVGESRGVLQSDRCEPQLAEGVQGEQVHLHLGHRGHGVAPRGDEGTHVTATSGDCHGKGMGHQLVPQILGRDLSEDVRGGGQVAADHRRPSEEQLFARSLIAIARQRGLRAGEVAAVQTEQRRDGSGGLGFGPPVLSGEGHCPQDRSEGRGGRRRQRRKQAGAEQGSAGVVGGRRRGVRGCRELFGSRTIPDREQGQHADRGVRSGGLWPQPPVEVGRS